MGNSLAMKVTVSGKGHVDYLLLLVSLKFRFQSFSVRIKIQHVHNWLHFRFSQSTNKQPLHILSWWRSRLTLPSLLYFRPIRCDTWSQACRWWRGQEFEPEGYVRTPSYLVRIHQNSWSESAIFFSIKMHFLFSVYVNIFQNKKGCSIPHLYIHTLSVFVFVSMVITIRFLFFLILIAFKRETEKIRIKKSSKCILFSFLCFKQSTEKHPWKWSPQT